MERLERLIARDPGLRGVAALQVQGDLAYAAGALAGAARVLVVTGFAVGPGRVAETDGPPGALFLGRALVRMGKQVVYATHRSCEPVMTAGVRELGLSVPVEVRGPGEPAEGILRLHAPALIVAIELPGRARDGQYYNMRGEPITDRVSPLDALLLTAAGTGIPTIAIGDGGNEAGMGKVIERVRATVPRGETIASVVASSALIAAGTSNWGAYGLLAALDGALLHAPEEELRLLRALIQAGALDGLTLQGEPTVDGIPPEVYLRTLVDLKRESGFLRKNQSNPRSPSPGGIG